MIKIIHFGELAHEMLAAPIAEGLKVPIIAIDGDLAADPKDIATRLFIHKRSFLFVNTMDFATEKDPLGWTGRFIRQIVVPLRTDGRGRYQVFDWNARALGPWRELGAPSALVLAGLGALQSDLRPYISCGLFVRKAGDPDFEDLLAMGWFKSKSEVRAWKRKAKKYLTEDRPDLRADMILLNCWSTDSGADQLEVEIVKVGRP